MFGLLKKKTAPASKPQQRSGIPEEFKYDRAYCQNYLATNRKAIKEREEFEKARAECNAYAARQRSNVAPSTIIIEQKQTKKRGPKK